jgi:Cdc6-like AAA superfamily ATPase
MGQLSKLLSTPPTTINVIVGPRSSGKTALISNYLKQEAELYPDKRRPLVYINCRTVDVSTPIAFSRELVDCTSSKLRKFANVAIEFVSTATSKVGMGGGSEVNVDASWLSKLQPGKDGMADILKAYNAQISAGKLRPIFIIDEANCLSDWGEDFQSERKALMSFFIAVTKEKQAAHVLLVTSDYSFLAWMKECTWVYLLAIFDYCFDCYCIHVIVLMFLLGGAIFEML